MEFQVGDLIVMNRKADRHYSYTKKGTEWYVLSAEKDGLTLGQADASEHYIEKMKASFALYHSVGPKDRTYKHLPRNQIRETRDFQVWSNIRPECCNLLVPYKGKNADFVGLLSSEGF